MYRKLIHGLRGEIRLSKHTHDSTKSPRDGQAPRSGPRTLRLGPGLSLMLSLLAVAPHSHRPREGRGSRVEACAAPPFAWQLALAGRGIRYQHAIGHASSRRLSLPGLAQRASPNHIPGIGRVGATHSLQCRAGASWPRKFGSGRHEALGEHSSQTQRPHPRQWWRHLRRWKSARHSSHRGASRFSVQRGGVSAAVSAALGGGGRIAVSIERPDGAAA